jgi:hypothetical protein
MPNIKHGLSLIPHFCKDCGNKVSDYRKTYCKNCFWKHNKNLFKSGKKHPSYKDGRCSKIYNCKICKNPITYVNNFYGSGYCKYCMNQFRANWMRIKMTGKSNPSYIDGRTIGIRKCIDCGKILNNDYAIRCMYHAALKRCKRGKDHYWFGKSFKFLAKYYKYKNFWFRSSWEANFAKWCDGSGIKWKYEPKTFDLGNCTYTPDFYLPEFDCWIEIKGRLTIYNKRKMRLFKKRYSKLKYFIFNQYILKEYGIIK